MTALRVLTGVAGEFPDFLRDESRRQGHADGIAFPEGEPDVRALLEECSRSKTRVTVQGARTGLTGGAVPDGGLVASLIRMDRLLDVRPGPAGTLLLRAEPGLRLEELRRILAGEAAGDRVAGVVGRGLGEGWLFPPDPTEATATLGGMAACNASGALSFRYGPTRSHIHALRVVLADGDVVRLERGEVLDRGDELTIRTEGGQSIRCRRPDLAMPDCKHAAGYFSRPGMDVLDLFVGAEGTLGVISEVEVVLMRAPACIWGAVVFLREETSVVELVEGLRRCELRPAALEYFSSEILELLRRHREAHPGFEAIPVLPPLPAAALYVEYHHETDGDLEPAMAGLVESLVARGGDPDQAWVATDSRELTRLKAFRHAAPECVNLRLDELRRREPRLTKLATDLAVPDPAFRTLLQRYRRDLSNSQMEYALFGHIGDNHLHVNLLPADVRGYEVGAAMYREWARLAVALGGSVSAEHGIGKLKRTMLAIQYDQPAIVEMRRVKASLDPGWILNPGTLFDAD